ncbi:uncharacterized protein LOC112046348 [Bicyclus anynana]|uniref:Uncharacterized protein LOC112046348 n=1 Tax=Bicyclus anynana TaxID=110368 RepID=A0ABM3M786_BICAN|nr:uncharacterized protein LOC112046348 [Bicyclus anynana]
MPDVTVTVVDTEVSKTAKEKHPCLTLTQASTREEAAEEIIERILGIPDSDKVLNSVLGRLQKNREEILQRAQATIDEDCDDSEELAEYTESVENTRERGLRRTSTQKHVRICEVNRTIHRLNNREYEYRPAYYEEVRCNSSGDHVREKEGVVTCSSIGLSCVQWNKTIHLTRRRYTSDCWETKTLIIPAGCECRRREFGAISSYIVFLSEAASAYASPQQVCVKVSRGGFLGVHRQ